jgi:hypothetical protein
MTMTKTMARLVVATTGGCFFFNSMCCNQRQPIINYKIDSMNFAEGGRRDERELVT